MFTVPIQAHLALRIPDWSARFLKMIEARGTAVETDIPHATETAHARETAGNLLEFVNRRMGGLSIEWKRVAPALHVTDRAVRDIKRDLREGYLHPKYVDNFTNLLRLGPEELLVRLKPYIVRRLRSGTSA